MKKSYILIVILLATTLNAQYTVNQWYFGDYAGLDFNTGNPVVLNGNKMSQREGNATICDAEGQLILYSDGQKIWNKKHQVINNGYGLMGNSSSTQSSIFVPDPSNDNQLYIFTSDAMETTWNNKGLRYNIVDYTADEGTGRVIKKNQLLDASASEKITAIDIPFENAYWVIAHGWNVSEFLVYKLDETGLNLYKKFQTNMYDDDDRNNDVNRGAGYLKFNLQSGKLCAAAEGKGFYLYDFDIFTGEITNEMIFLQNDIQYAYGVEFSKSGKMLYITTISGDWFNNYLNEIFQFDISLPTKQEIYNSKYKIVKRYDDGAGIQMAPDGKIYIAKGSRFLDVINNPEGKRTDCDFKQDVVDLGSGKLVHFGFPNFIQEFIAPQSDIDGTEEVCIGNEIYLEASYHSKAEYEWLGPNNFYAETREVSIKNALPENEGRYYCKTTFYGKHFDHDTIFVKIQNTEAEFELERLDLGSVCTGSYSSAGINFFNIGNTHVDINSVRLKSGNFELIRNKDKLGLGDSIYYELQLNQLLPGIYTDSLIIKYSGICGEKEAIVEVIGAIEYFDLKVTFPDLHAEVGDKICFDVLGEISCEWNGATDFTFDLVYDPNVFYVSEIQNGEIISTNFPDENSIKQKILITDPGKLNIDSILCTICGEVLLNKTKNTDFSAENYSAEEYGNIETVEGSLLRGGICVEELQYFKIYDMTELSVSVDNRNVLLKVEGEERGKYSIDLYNVELKSFFQRSWISNGPFVKEMTVEGLSAGTYFIVLHTPAGFTIYDRIILI